MKDHNILKAAHGSSGASELNTRGAGVLMSAKKKISIIAALFAAFPLFSFGSDWLVSGVNVYTNKYSGFENSPVVVTVSKPFPVSDLDDFLLSRNLTLGFRNVFGSGFQPQVLGATNITVSLTYPFKLTDGTSVFYGDWSLAPRTYALFSVVNSLYASGFTNGIQVLRETSSDLRLNFQTRVVIDSILYGVETPFKSRVLSLLSSATSSINNINLDVGQLQTDYNSVNQLALNPAAFQYSDLPTMNGSSDFAYQASSVLSDPYISPAIKSQFAANLGRVYGDYLSKAAEVYALDQQDPNSPSYGKSFGDFLSEAGGFSKSMQYQYSTPLTNGMQRMTTDWKNAVTNDLAQNTASITNRLAQNTVSITNQLAQWKRDLHDDVNGVAGQLSSVIIDGGNESAVRVNANITGGQMTINGGSIEVGDLSIGRITDGMDGIQGAIQQALADWLDEWYDWAYRNPDSWSEFYRRFYAEFGPEVVTNQERQISLLMGVTNALYTAAWTNELVNIISNGVAGLDLSITNEIWDYYFDRFKKANEFKDDGGLPFSLDLVRQQVFGTGFDESRYRQLDWFSRVELLLYQIGFAETNDVPEVADIQTELEDVADTVSTHAEDFVATSVKVVSVFNLLRRFADSVKLAFTPANGELSPMTSGIVLLQGGSWLVNEPLVLNVPVPIQNALRLVFQCIWYLGAFVLGWRVFSAAWDRIVSVVRWLWSVFDV